MKIIRNAAVVVSLLVVLMLGLGANYLEQCPVLAPIIRNAVELV
jgi:hypothetical protein